MTTGKNSMMLKRWRTRSLATIVVGAACFVLGSGALAQADWLPPGHVYTIGDASTPNLTLKLSGAGEMKSVDDGTRARLDTLNAKLAPLAIDPQNGLKVSVQGTTEVDGHVAVDNLPAVQEVTGTIAIANLPPTQEVVGSVTVASLPPISGGVNVNNFPGNQDVNVTGGTVDIQPTTTADDEGGFELHNDGTSDLDYFTAALHPFGCQVGTPCDPPAVLQSPKFRKLELPSSPHYLTLVSINTTNNVAFICAQGDKIILRMHVGPNVVREFVHPLKVTSCYLECVDTEPDFLEPWKGPKCSGNFSLAGIP